MSGDERYTEVTGSHVLISGRINFDVVVGDVAEADEDVIVHSTGPVLTLGTPLASAMAKKGGDGFVQGCKKFAPLADGSVVVTGGFNLKCKQIVHCNCPHWKEGGNKNLQKILMACLERCGMYNHTSVAFPAIGSGAKSYPKAEVTRGFIEAMTKYAQKYPQSSVKRVKMYIFAQAEADAMQEEFMETIKVLSRQHEGSLSRDGRCDFVIGNLAETKADVIVNSTGSTLSLSSVLLNKAGQALQEECNKNKYLKGGDIVVTEGFGLSCESVFHVSCPDTWKGDETEEKLVKLILKCLSWAEDRRLKSIAFPAVGMGMLKYPADAVARCFTKSAMEFAEDRSFSSLETLLVVIASEDKTTISGFEKVIGQKLSTQRVKSAAVKTSRDEKIIIDLPSYWQKPENKYAEFVIAEGTKEWTDTIDDFKKTLGANFKIVQVTRVQNPELYMLFDVRRKHTAIKLGKQESEVETAPLWHGTKESCISKITRGKFDRGLSGSVGANLLGAGSYFSTTTKYSAQDMFSPKNSQGEKIIVLARVVTGDYCVGKGDLKAAPYKPDDPEVQYDSVVNIMKDPTMYAVFHDASAYPEYIIKFILV